MTPTDPPPEPPAETTSSGKEAPGDTRVPIDPIHKMMVGAGLLCLILWVLTLDLPFANPHWPPAVLSAFRASEPHTSARYSPALKFAFNDVAFLDEQRGIGVADRGILLRTEDGGRSWRPATGVTWADDEPIDVAEDVLTALRLSPTEEKRQAPSPPTLRVVPTEGNGAPQQRPAPSKMPPQEPYNNAPNPSQRSPKAAGLAGSDLRQAANLIAAELPPTRLLSPANAAAQQSQDTQALAPLPPKGAPAEPTTRIRQLGAIAPVFPAGAGLSAISIREVEVRTIDGLPEAWAIGDHQLAATDNGAGAQPGVPVLLHTRDLGRTWRGIYLKDLEGMRLRRLRTDGPGFVAVLATDRESPPIGTDGRAGAQPARPDAFGFMRISGHDLLKVHSSPLRRLHEVGGTLSELWAIGATPLGGDPSRTAGALALSENGGKTWKLAVDLPAVTSLESLNAEARLAVDDKGRLINLDPAGKFRFAGMTAPDAIAGLVSSATRLWSYGEAGTCYRAADGKWVEAVLPVQSAQNPGASPAVQSLGFIEKFGWALRGDQLLVTTDEGAAWADPRRYTRLPSPVSWMLLALGLGLVSPIFFHRTPKLPEHLRRKSIANFYLSDAPLEDPRRASGDLAALAGGVARFLRNEFTGAPLVLGVCGAWGSGKSSLMNLIRAQLSDRGFHPVWFNAWHHEQESHLLAALLQNIREQAIPPVFSWHGLFYRLELARQRYQRRWVYVVVLLLALAMLLGFLANGGPAALKMEFSDANSFLISALALLPFGAAAAPLLGLLRMLGAFGIDPGKLALGTTSGAKASDSREMTSFRHRFAVEFKEVTQALKPKRMVVFIDDLDRCQPDHMMSVLETINFLSTSGEVFIVLSMEKRAVLACLARKLSGWTDQYKAAFPEADVPTPAAYAELWLEKLVQVEVTVPALSPDEMKALAGAREVATPEEPPGAVGAAASLAGLPWRTILFGLLLIAAIVTAACFGYSRAGSTRGQVSDTKPRSWYARGEFSDGLKFNLLAADAELPAAPVATRAETAPPTNTGSTDSTSTTADSTGAVNLGPPPVEEPRATVAVTVAPPQRSWLYPWIVVPCLLLAIATAAFALKRLHRYFQGTVTDSRDFREAVERWWSEIERRERTPRALKRLVNRLRLYASLARDTTTPEGGSIVSERAIVGFGTMEEACPTLLSRELGLDPANAEQAKAELDRLGPLRPEAEQVLRELKSSPARDAVRRLTAALRT